VSSSSSPRHRREALDRIIRRAAELQFQATEEGADVSDGLTEDEILRIGGEVGLDPGHLRRAMSELRADTLAPEMAPESSVLARFYGEGTFQVSRAVRGEIERISPRLHGWMRQRESLVPIRERVGASMWEPNASWNAQMERAFKRRGHTYDLARVKALEVQMVALEPGWILVTLRADLRNVRGEMALGWGIPFLMGAAVPTGVVLGVVAGFPAPLALLGSAGAGLLGVGGTLPFARATFGAYAGRLKLAMEGLLDRVERDDLEVRSSGNPLSQFFERS
jgi:hypothetical protein